MCAAMMVLLHFGSLMNEIAAETKQLVRLQAVQLRQDRMFGEILIRKHVGFEAVMSEQAAVRDDWK